MGAMKTKITMAGVLMALTLGAGAAWGAGTTLTLKGGYFFPSDSVFKEVYSGGPVFGADVAVPIGGILQVWGGAELFSKTGSTTLTEEETKVSIVPLFLGLRVEGGKKSLRPYLGVAAAYFLFSEKNVLRSISQSGFGYLAQTGLLAWLGGAIWLEAHVGYRGCTLKTDDPDPIEAKLDGLSAGLGVAFRF
jgi:outer membrane protein W